MNKVAMYVVCVAIAIAGLFYLHNREVDKAVNAAYTHVENESNKRLLALKNKADAETLALQFKIKEQEDEKQSTIADLNKRHATIVAGLQQRPNRPTSNTGNNSGAGTAESTRGAYPSELFREDAADIIEVARAADELKIHLLQCYKQYDEVKESIEEFSRQNK